MKNTPVKISIILFLILFSLSCLGEDKPIDDVNTLRPNVNQNKSANEKPNANIVEDNEVKLREIIKMPFEPTGDSPWRVDALDKSSENRESGQAERKLTVILKFSDEDTEKLLEKVKGKRKAFEVSIDAENWFPAELIAKSDTAGDTTLKGLSYSAEDFIKPPYKNGNLIHIDGADFFVLVLQTK